MNLFLKTFEQNFSELHNSSCELIESVPAEMLFWKPCDEYLAFSCGEYVLRSSGLVEQAFGGIMTRLWDDPFEWSLPEELSTNEKVLAYLKEVEENRRKAFDFFKSDEDLRKEISTPEGMRTLFEVFIKTLAKAENLQGRAISVFQMFPTKLENKRTLGDSLS